MTVAEAGVAMREGEVVDNIINSNKLSSREACNRCLAEVEEARCIEGAKGRHRCQTHIRGCSITSIKHNLELGRTITSNLRDNRISRMREGVGEVCLQALGALLKVNSRQIFRKDPMMHR